MKRLILIILVIAAVAWTIYSGYELFLNKGNSIAPKRVFCQQDESILQINRIEEIESVDYFEVVGENPFIQAIKTLNTKHFSGLKIYLSGARPIAILEKESKWKEEELEDVRNSFSEVSINFKHEDNVLLISKPFEPCQHDSSKVDFFIEGDKKASANFWKLQSNSNWKRTDVYALDKGFFEYRSSVPKVVYGKAVNDISSFSTVLPSNISAYTFNERFYAFNNDTIFAQGLVSSWVDLGYVSAAYQDEEVLFTDYRSQQQPGLILLEKSPIEDSVKILEDIKSFTGFQLTRDFPRKKGGRIFLVELEDKVVFSEKESIARQILVDYQLGKTLALNPVKKEQFFGGLPSQVNHRAIDKNEKTSLTWKKDLLFEVSTKPPGEKILEEEKTNWSFGLNLDPVNMVPIPDHLRNGTSIFSHDKEGNYQLVGPNGNPIWKGKTNNPIVSKPIVIDVFENNKHQFLFRTEKSVHLIDLNGNEVGGFPYKSDTKITTQISEFIWNGTKRFLFGNEKGEVTMVNSSGQELTIIQLGRHAIRATPYALNIGGNLRVWVVNDENEQFLGYLESPAAPKILGKTLANHFVKQNSEVYAFFEKENKIYFQSFNDQNPSLLSSGNILKLNDEHIYIKDNNNIQVYNHNKKLLVSQKLPFNEIGSVNYFNINKKEYLVVMDYLQNKINVYDGSQNTLQGFPKEGREKAVSYYNKESNILYIYTLISKSIVCYKVEI